MIKGFSEVSKGGLYPGTIEISANIHTISRLGDHISPLFFSAYLSIVQFLCWKSATNKCSPSGNMQHPGAIIRGNTVCMTMMGSIPSPSFSIIFDHFQNQSSHLQGPAWTSTIIYHTLYSLPVSLIKSSQNLIRPPQHRPTSMHCISKKIFAEAAYKEWHNFPMHARLQLWFWYRK